MKTDLRGRIRSVARWASTHSATVNSVASVDVQLRRDAGPLALLGAAASLGTIAGQFLRAPPPSAWLADAQTLTVPGVDLLAALAKYGVTERFDDCTWEADWTSYRVGCSEVVGYRHAKSVVYYRGGLGDELREAARTAMWTSQHLRVQTTGDHFWATITAVPCTEEPGQASPAAEHLWRRLRGFVDAGRPRSLLIDGRPGTGKSTAVRWIADRVGGRRLRVSASEVARAEPEALASLVELLRPDVVVFDDFDRAGTHDLALDAIERVRRACRLLIATTNNVERVTAAAVRPRRFDEHATVDTFDVEFVRAHLGATWDALSAEDREVVQRWPIVYLDDLVDRTSYIDGVDLHAEVLDLDRRASKRTAAAWEVKPKGADAERSQSAGAALASTASTVD